MRATLAGRSEARERRRHRGAELRAADRGAGRRRGAGTALARGRCRPAPRASSWQAAAEETGAAATGARPRAASCRRSRRRCRCACWQASLQPLTGTLTLPLAPPADALPGSAPASWRRCSRGSAARCPACAASSRPTPTPAWSSRPRAPSPCATPRPGPRLRDEVAGYLDSDGLAGYFPPAPGDPPRGSDRLTAHLLSAAHEAGWAWPDGRARRHAARADGLRRRAHRAPLRRAARRPRRCASWPRWRRWRATAARTPRLLGSVGQTRAAWPTSALLDLWSVLRRVQGVPQGDAEAGRGAAPAAVAPARRRHDAALQHRGRRRLVVADGRPRRQCRAAGAGGHRGAGLAGRSAAARERRAGAPASAAPGPPPPPTCGACWRWSVLPPSSRRCRWPAAACCSSAARRSTLDWQAAPDGGAMALPLPAAGATLAARHEGAGRPWLTVQTLAAVPLQRAAGRRLPHHAQRERGAAPAARGLAPRRHPARAAGDRGAGRHDLGRRQRPGARRRHAAGRRTRARFGARHAGERREGSAWPAYEERAAEAWRATTTGCRAAATSSSTRCG